MSTFYPKIIMSFLFITVCMCVSWNIYIMGVGTLIGQERVLDPLDLELQTTG